MSCAGRCEDCPNKCGSSKTNDAPFSHQPIFTKGEKATTKFRKLEKLSSGVRSEVWTEPDGTKRQFLKVDDSVISELTKQAMLDINFLLRPAHLEQLQAILTDEEASSNDKYVAHTLIRNACIAAGRELPGCQDTGTAIVMAKKGEDVRTTGDDEESLCRGVYDAYQEANLRFSQVAPLTIFDETNTKTNLPAQVDIYAQKGAEYEFLFIAKGGGSANKTNLYQMTKAVLNETALSKWLETQIKSIGTAACPPYHLAIVIGGTSAESTLKTVKLASCKYLDDLPRSGNELGRAFRDEEWEGKVLEMTRKLGVGAQFGGKYFCHDVRVIRLPRHGASCPIGIGVSCSADRQIVGKINADGVFLEALEEDPARFLPADLAEDSSAPGPVEIDLNQPMDSIRKQLSRCPVKTRLSLTGVMVVARDIAHAKIAERLKETGSLPKYVKDHPIYYAGPAKCPEGMPSGSFGPTTAGRMDSYVAPFMAAGGSFVTLAKGNRSVAVREACGKYGGFYLGSIGGPAADLAKNCIKKVEILEYADLGMEAVWRIEVVNFPAFVVVDDKGNDFFQEWLG